MKNFDKIMSVFQANAFRVSIIFIYSKMTAQKMTCNAYEKIIAAQFGPSSYDVRFIFPDSKEIPAHKKLLSIMSTVFHAMFDGNWSEASGSVQITDSSYEMFSQFMAYFYTNTLEITVTNAPDLLDLAKKYDVEDVAARCVTFMIQHMFVEHVTDWLYCALQFDLEALTSACQAVISERTIDVLRSEAFLRCEQKTLANILNLNSIECSEVELFDASIEWAKASCQRKNINATDYRNIGKELDNCLKLIRFTAMDRQDIIYRRDVLQGVTPTEKFHSLQWDLIENNRVPSRTRAQSNCFIFNFDKNSPAPHFQKSSILFSLSKPAIFTGINISNVFDELTDELKACSIGFSGHLRLHHYSSRCLSPKNLIDQRFSIKNETSDTVVVELERECLFNSGCAFRLEISLNVDHPSCAHVTNMYEFKDQMINGIALNGNRIVEFSGMCILERSSQKSFVSQVRFKKLDENSLKDLDIK